MALAIVQTAVYGSGAAVSGTMTPTFGSTPTVGNLMVAFVSYNSGATVSTPSGWTVLDTSAATTDGDRIKTYYRVVVSGDSTSYTFTTSGGTPAPDYTSAVLYEISGQAATGFINQHSTAVRTTATSWASPSATPSVIGCLPLVGYAPDFAKLTATAPTFTITSGWTIDRQTQNNTYHPIIVGSKNAVTTDTTTAITATATTNQTGDSCAVTIILIAPAASSAITKTQTATARIATSPTKTQTATARITKAMSSLTDNFSTKDVVKWYDENGSPGAWPTNASIVSGQLAINATPSYDSLTSAGYDIYNDIASIQIVQLPTQGVGDASTEMGFEIEADVNNKTQVIINGSGAIVWRIYTNNVLGTNGTATYNPATMAWLRWRGTNTGNLVLEYAATYTGTWTALVTYTPTWSLRSVEAQFYAGYWGTQATPGTAIFDNFNTQGSFAGTATQPATARIANQTSKTQPATSRISIALTKTQPATARVAKAGTKTQPATARVAISPSKAQTSTARVATTRTNAQTATSRITTNRTATQTATARVRVNTVTAAELTSNGTGTDATSFTTASITPTANALLLAWVYTIAAADPNHATITGAGLTWSEVASIGDGSGLRRLTLLKAQGAGTSGALTIDFAGQTQAGADWSIIQYSGVAASGAVVQSVTNFSTSTVSSLAVTLGSFSSTDNATAAGFGVPLNTASTPGTGYTQTGEKHQTSPNQGLITEFRIDNDLNPSASFTGAVPATGIAVEIKAAAANNKNQTATARIAVSGTNTQSATARVTASRTATQTATGRVATNPSKAQNATARISQARTKTQPATGRIAAVISKIQNATARVATSPTKAQTATARLATSRTAIQVARGRVAVSTSKTQPAISRISRSFTAAQNAGARVATSRTKAQTATANILTNSGGAKTQTATARITAVVTKIQTATGRIAKSFTRTQSATARVAQNGTQTQTATARIYRGLVAWYKLDGNGNDSSGNGFNGSLVGAPTGTTDRFAMPNGALSFTTSPQNVTIPDNSAFAFGPQPFTVSAWLNFDSSLLGQYGGIISQGGNSFEVNKSSGNSLRVEMSIVVAGVPTLMRFQESSPSLTAANTWYHVVANFDPATGVGQLWVNGASRTITYVDPVVTGTFNDSTSAVYIGQRTSGALQWKGSLDDVRVYDRTLSSAEVAALYTPAINGTKTQPATARIAINKTAAQSAAARIAVTRTTTQGATARILAGKTKTQTAIGRIAKALTKTQPATARVATSRTATQTATARVGVSPTKTQAATARVAQARTAAQTAGARVAKAGTKTQTAISRVAVNKTKTQTATGRVAIVQTKTQTARARVGIVRTASQGATARVVTVEVPGTFTTQCQEANPFTTQCQAVKTFDEGAVEAWSFVTTISA